MGSNAGPPLLRVSRVKAACARCRNAKTKCDGKLPACSACEKAGRAAECASTSDEFAQGNERSYVATLESRLDKLQKRLAKANNLASPSPPQPEDNVFLALQTSNLPFSPTSPIVEVTEESEEIGPGSHPGSTTGNNGNGNGNGVSALSPSARSEVRSPARSKEASNINDLVSDFGFLSVNATARDFYGFTSTVSYARLVLAAAARNELPTERSKLLPSRREALALSEHYMSNIFVVLPVFEETAFWVSFDTMFANPRIASPLDRWNLRMVLAIALLSYSEHYGDSAYNEAVGHMGAALDVADSVLHPGSLASIQAMLLLVEYARLDPHHFDTWTLVGAASRTLVDLGLHQDPQRGVPMPKARLEARRRVYHCLYALDRATSMAQERALSFSDDSANVGFPRMSAALPTPVTSSRVWLQSYDGALDVFRLRQLQSRLYQDIFQTSRTPWAEPYTYIWKCWQNLNEWHRTLSTTTPPTFSALLRLELLYSWLYMLQPSPRVPEICDLAQSLIFEYTIDFVDGVYRGMNDPAIRPWINSVDDFRISVAGRIFVSVLSKYQARLLLGRAPDPTTLPEAATAAPPFSFPERTDNTHRSIQTITRLVEILRGLGIRFGNLQSHDRFQSESQYLLNTLLAGRSPVASSMSYQDNIASSALPFSGSHTTHNIVNMASPPLGAHGEQTGQILTEGLPTTAATDVYGLAAQSYDWTSGGPPT